LSGVVLPVTVLYLTDIHARIEPEARTLLPALRGLLPPRGDADQLTLGLASIEQLVVHEKEMCGTEPVLFINCGDLIGIEMVHDWAGAGLVTLEALETMVERAGIEHCFSVVGNHEMDFGIDGFRRLKSAARRFRFLAGNLAIDGVSESPPFEIVTVGALRIALVALTVELTRIDAPVADRDRLAVAKPAPAAEAALAELRARKAAGEIDVVIGAVHLADEQDVEIAGIEGIDLLLGGHSHAFHNRLLGPRSLPYGKAGCHAQVLGTVRLEHAGGAVQMTRSLLIPGAPDPTFVSRVAAVFGPALEQIKLEFPARFRAVALLPHVIGGLNRVRGGEVPIGRVVAEMMLEVARRASAPWVHLAFINGGNIRQEILGAAGQVRATDLHAVVPWMNEILLVDASREIVMRALYNCVACAMIEKAGFLQFAGIRFRIDAVGAIHDVEVQTSAAVWSPLERVDTLRLATIDFLVREEGGHHYRFLGAEAVTATGQRLPDAWIDSLARSVGAAAPGSLPELRAPAGRCLTVDDGFKVATQRDVLATVDAGVGGQLAWVRARL
jgi:2',3'-cyclic-nucleotide 2'-phosphodiesterase (5'-nucleotidase family)